MAGTTLKILGGGALVLAIGAAVTGGTRGRERTVTGRAEAMGAGTVQSFLRLDPKGVPLAIGVTLSPGALERLPAEPNRLSRCFDVNGDGRHGLHECHGDEERILELPRDAAESVPYRWMMVNWNPAGHHNTPYAQAHFDFHFYTGERSRIEAIRSGRCGELADCDDMRRATRPLPPEYLPNGYIDVGAVVPRMGNHLLDSQSPELKGSTPFTTTFIYGAYQGELIFWEPMITLDYLKNTRETCLEIRQPSAFREAGYYPTQYCVRQNQKGERTVSLERFKYSEAL
jgi:hypothetical protein